MNANIAILIYVRILTPIKIANVSIRDVTVNELMNCVNEVKMETKFQLSAHFKCQSFRRLYFPR